MDMGSDSADRPTSLTFEWREPDMRRLLLRWLPPARLRPVAGRLSDWQLARQSSLLSRIG